MACIVQVCVIPAIIQIPLNFNNLAAGGFKHFLKSLFFFKKEISGTIGYFVVLPVYFFKQCTALKHMELKYSFFRSNEISAVPCVSFIILS